ncbi:DUF4492 domain-containing protein [Sunxiuqinia elliptica]|uniref:DUF4492 domain-containing protein n=1 Tax=Sunxiuqinia elliptica TaxID=655355 RepID=A0A1I2K9L9_9BACT|nr:DUF4492 domain-containing protein [Sunxiuqinia elliptica]SFF63019.1 protein of unknown function [Sunxiuqinia elliptica]
MKKGLFSRVWSLYYDGFRNMGKWGRQVWLIIFIKLFIMFFVLKLFFFPNFLKTNFETDEERGNHVLENLVEPIK